MSYLKSLKTLTPDITSPPNSGAILAVTSEPSQHLDATRKSSGYQGEVIVDVENKLAAYLKEKGWLDVAVSKKGGYDRGMAQPAVLVLRKKGQDVEVLYSWAIVPGTVSSDLSPMTYQSLRWWWKGPLLTRWLYQDESRWRERPTYTGTDLETRGRAQA